MVEQAVCFDDKVVFEKCQAKDIDSDLSKIDNLSVELL